ncbi:hypothetical protein TcasGA2_TC010734 [Tribolium castaneum]|uniref:Uncharacterized protein n=1 Tax=Tribolium castaneum TaxID=7070 RepID=D7GXW2_TRICA|nr:hypothetical protein TcasGA2_TC010734 [Tribolium castaneum]
MTGLKIPESNIPAFATSRLLYMKHPNDAITRQMARPGPFPAAAAATFADQATLDAIVMFTNHFIIAQEAAHFPLALGKIWVNLVTAESCFVRRKFSHSVYAARCVNWAWFAFATPNTEDKTSEAGNRKGSKS